MDELNFHHLNHFWAVARTGSLTRAARDLGLTPPTLSAQIRALERALGQRLLRRLGRGLALTEPGRVVLRYAEEIFGLGRELRSALSGEGETGRPLRFEVGITDALPKLVAYRLLAPALVGPEPIHLVVREDRPPRLLADLALHRLDLVLSDSPIGSEAKVRAFHHLLGECEVACFAAPVLARTLRRGFPGSLHGRPFLAPIEGSALRRSIDSFFEREGIRPNQVAEVEDSALLKVLGQQGMGAFAAPRVVSREIRQQYGVIELGVLPGITERFYAISAERRLKHPAVVALSQAARSRFARSTPPRSGRAPAGPRRGARRAG
ncbi:MAG: LysR family transcriptional regulator [Candidatus Eisenbacteria bacterium]|nr:LysR family transcriptional regulator [Candidatus Eisenbacteria bacterium]